MIWPLIFDYAPEHNYFRRWRKRREENVLELTEIDAALAIRKAARQQFNASRKRDREGRFA